MAESNKPGMSFGYRLGTSLKNLFFIAIFGGIAIFIAAVTTAIAAANIAKLSDYSTNEDLKRAHTNLTRLTLILWIGGAISVIFIPLLEIFIQFPYLSGALLIGISIINVVVAILAIKANLAVKGSVDYKKTSAADDAFNSTLAAAISGMVAAVLMTGYAIWEMVDYGKRGGVSVDVGGRLKAVEQVGGVLAPEFAVPLQLVGQAGTSLDPESRGGQIDPRYLQAAKQYYGPIQVPQGYQAPQGAAGLTSLIRNF
jgi:hypothetical protein